MDGQRPQGAVRKSFEISEWEVAQAWEKVRASKGAPGVDAVSLEAFEAGLKDNLYKIWNRMSSGTYFPPPVRAVEIPRPHGKGTRMLGVPAIADRVAQTVVAARIGAVAEPVFRPDSYGYRPGRSPHDGIGRCRERCWKQDWVVDLDVSKFFDSVRWDLVIKAVQAHADLPWVILYVKRWLAAPVQMPGGSVRERDRGTPQGSAVSPVLANLFLHYAFDTWMVREFPDCPFGRFADDAVVHCSSRARARQVLAALGERTEQAGLALHPEKTRIVYCRDGNRRGPRDGPVSFTFLGYTFGARSMNGRRGRFTGYGPAVSSDALAKLSQQVPSWRLRRKNTLSWTELARWLGPVIRGWTNYYGQYYRSQLYPLLARINHHIQRWLKAKYKRLRNNTALRKAWQRATARNPSAMPHWKWVTSTWW